ncbi:hypothetical protein CDAR_168281 [Caerostris darwini]|uniref:Uncharacterized protein n=1 Tax=Caerostris darwini TaxID=1538125 RepID=A0AAV4T656_9ARAC|nr:hypothetical protein CDAR_168281 [Caerostris darwini]
MSLDLANTALTTVPLPQSCPVHCSTTTATSVHKRERGWEKHFHPCKIPDGTITIRHQPNPSSPIASQDCSRIIPQEAQPYLAPAMTNQGTRQVT